MRNRGLLLLVFLFSALPSLAQDGPPPMPELTGEIVIEGLNGPQGLHVAADGSVYVIDSGVGGEEVAEFVNPETFEVEEGTFGQTARILRLTPAGETEEIAVLPSITVGQDAGGGARIVELDDTLYATVGAWQEALGEDVTVEHFSAVVRIDKGSLETVADLWVHELENNPDETGNRESHPYGIAAGPDGLLYVADAAANALISVDPTSGKTETVAVFEGQPGLFPNPFRNDELISDPVPTGVAFNDEGTIFISYLSGAPFIPGTAKVVQVTEDGMVSDFASGLTMLTDLKMGPDGNLYAVSFGMFTQEGPVFNSGSVLRILEDGSAEIVIQGLPFATAIAFDDEGNGYVAINGAAIPNAGMVVYYEALTEMEGQPLPTLES